jgi:hypothetical protein
MKPSASFQFSRRALMKAAGSTLLVPTFLKQAFAQTATPARPNLIILMQTNGTHQASFWPTGTTYAQWSTAPATQQVILNPILTDPVIGPLTTVVSGIYLNKQANPGGDGHDWGWHGIYSGHDNISGSGGQFGGGPSVDQVLVNSSNLTFTTPFKTKHCGVIAANYSLINAGRASWVCASAGLQQPCETDIYSLYTEVFGSVTVPAAAGDAGPSAAATQAAALRLAQRKSVLDTVAADLQALEARLGPTEAAKVDLHLQAVRDFETRLSNMLTTGAQTNPAMCTGLQPAVAGLVNAQNYETNAPELFTLFMTFLANVIGCNMSTIMTFQAGRGGEHFHYDWLDIPGMQPDFHNDIAHRDLTADSTSGNPGGVMVAVAQYQANMVLSLAQQLSKFPGPNGATALDNTLIVYGNELATGPHGLNGYPIVFIGGAAGQLTKTGYMVGPGQISGSTASGAQMSQTLGCTILNIMGVKATGFGWEPNCGVIQGLAMA